MLPGKEWAVNGFIDMHTHILPGTDDGAATVEDSLEMLRLAWEQGTRAAVLTPHFRGRYKQNTPQQLQERFSRLQDLTREKLPGMDLYLGQEIHYDAAVPEALSAGQLLSINSSGYVLLEFHPGSSGSQILRGVSEVILSGFIPILAHGERYACFRKDASLREELLRMGTLIQLNAGSVLGHLGFSVRRCCHKLLKQGQAHFIASDCHDTAVRTPQLRTCFLKISKKYGQSYAAQLFEENPLAVIRNEVI